MNKTILYYTSNHEDPVFEQKIIDSLLENCGNLPIVSVSQKPIKLGQNVDLTTTEETLITTNDLDKYDLNSDGKTNAADNVIILQNLGKNPKNTRADINEDAVVDQKDLDLMSQKLKELGSQ